MINRLLAESLVEEGLLSKEQLSEAIELQKKQAGSLEQVLIDKGFVTEEKLLKSLARKMNTSFVSLSKYKVDPATVKLLPVSLAKKYHAIALFKIENKMVIATSNPTNLEGLDDIRRALGMDIDTLLALDSDIGRAIKEYYRGVGLTEGGTGQKVEVIEFTDEAAPDVTVEKLTKAASGEKIVNTVNNIISQTYEDRASDVHIEPLRGNVKVRARIDGVLEELATLDKSLHLPIVSRIKVMGGMDIAERRTPQDGRVHLRIGGKELDVRIATYPTVFGEAAAIRFLSKEQLMTLEELGFLENDLNVFKKLILKPHGMFLVTGPTGSGKTTTLYAALMRINSKEKHVLSIEDPVENEIPGVDQQMVNTKAGMTFASSLRSMLRQDPDVIMVGEIRDKETADIAVRAAMTGHLVFSTLHTNTAIGAVPRLFDLGVEPYALSSSLIGVLAQRLVRRICLKCKTKVDVDIGSLRALGIKEKIETFKGAGCKYCRNTGYFGRIGLFEIVAIEDQLKEMVANKNSEVKMNEFLQQANHKNMVDDGVEKIRSGITTVEEVLRVVEEGII